MIKVLIADDESTIREGIKNAVLWSELDMVVVAEADNGKIALELAIEHRPHLLLVDINMPVLNGLSLIEKIKVELPESLVIIITGYNEFEYARQGIMLVVTDYLLKPVSKVALKNALKRAGEQIESMEQERRINTSLKQHIDDNKDILLEKILQEITTQMCGSDEVEKKLSFFNLDTSNNPYMYLITPIFVSDHTHKEVLVVLAELKELFQNSKKHCVYLVEGNIVILSFPSNMNEQMEDDAIITKTLGKHNYPSYKNSAFVEGGIAGSAKTYNLLSEGYNQKSNYSLIIKLALKYINENYQNKEISINDVAESINISPSYLSKMFKKDLSLTFVDYLSLVRARNATKLLSDPTMKIYEIAEQVGYNSQHYFCTAFKKIYNVSPIEFRKMGQKK